jgi:membrane-associated phospholipid phosphatase
MEKLKTFKSKIIDFWNDNLVNKLLILVIFSWIILAVIFGFADLAISIAVVDSDTGFGNFGDDFGEAPGWGLIAIAIVIIIAGFVSKRVDDPFKPKLPALIVAILALGVMIYGIVDEDASIIAIAGTIGFAILIFIVITYNKDWNNYKKFAIVIAALGLINPLLFVQILKYTCGRVRFRNLAVGFTDFTPWIAPPWVFNGGESFPSGHTAMGWMLLPLLFFVTKKDKVFEKDSYLIISIIAILGVIFWGLFVGASRVIEGAHYASDVLFSTGMAAVTTIILYKYYYLQEEGFKFKLKRKDKPPKVKKVKKKKEVSDFDTKMDLKELSKEVVEKYESDSFDEEFPFEE